MPDQTNPTPPDASIDPQPAPSPIFSVPAPVIAPPAVPVLAAPAPSPSPYGEDLNFDDLDTLAPMKPTRVWLTTLGKWTYVMALSAGQRAMVDKDVIRYDAKKDMTSVDTSRVRILVAMFGWVNPAGTRQFQGPIGENRMQNMRADIVAEVAAHIERLSGGTAASQAEAVGNSDSSRTADAL